MKMVIDGSLDGFGYYCYGFENVTFVSSSNDFPEDYDFNGR